MPRPQAVFHSHGSGVLADWATLEVTGPAEESDARGRPSYLYRAIVTTTTSP